MKKTLSTVLALLMIVSVMFAVPFTASAAGVNAFNDTMVGDMQGLNDALVKAESGTRICLYGDITATPYYPYPIGVQSDAVKKGGTVVLDLNGFSIDITTTTMKNLFEISQMTDFYVINSAPDHDSSINFSTKKSGTDGNGSVFLVDNEQASLIVSGVDVSLCKDSDYQPTGEVSIMSVINCKDFYRLHLYDSTLTNHTSIGSGIIFQPTSSTAYAQSDVKVLRSTIKSASFCINYQTSYNAAYMQFAYSLLDCDEYYYTAFDLPSSCTYTFGQVSASGFKAYKVAPNNTLASISDSTKIVDFTDKADISFDSSRFGTHFHTAEALVNTVDGHYMICKTCGVSTGNEAHNGKIEAVAATCTTDGHTEGYDCSCGYNVRAEMIAPTGHQHTEEKAAVAATCAENGYTAGVYCNDCKTWLSGHEEIAATGDHKTETKIVTKATTSTDGTSEEVCTVCENTIKTTVIPKASSITISATKYVYDGTVKNPTVTVKDSTGKKLVKNVDYKISASSGRKNVGKYTVKVTLIGKYSGSKSFTMYILPGTTSKIAATSSTSAIKLSWKAVPGATGYSVYYYSTSAKKYKKIKDVSATTCTVSGLKSGTDYKFAIKAYAKVGSTVYQADSYKTYTYTTKPGTPTLKAVAGSKKATLSWNKQTGADGYVLYMATSKDGKYTKIATLKGNGSVSYTKTGLTKGKTYYFKVAAYSTVSSTNIYGSFSAAQYCKVK